MRLQKLVTLIMLFVALCFLSISAYSENCSNIQINCPINPKDTLVKSVLQIYEQMISNNGNLATKIENLKPKLDPNVHWTYEGVIWDVPFAGHYVSVLGVETFWKNFFRSVVLHRPQLRYYLHQGNKVHLHWLDIGTVKSTGKRFMMETVQVWEFNDQGLLVNFRCFNDTYAMWNAFQRHTDPQLSLVQHPQDYYLSSQDTVVDPIGVAKNLYIDFMTGNLPDILAKTADDTIIVFAGPKVTPEAGVYYGPQGMYQFLMNLVLNYRYEAYEQFDFITDGCRVDVLWHETFVAYPTIPTDTMPTATGKIGDLIGLHSMAINSRGQIFRFRSYNDTYTCAWGYTKTDEEKQDRWDEH